MEHVKVNIDISQYMQSLIHNLLYAIIIMLFAIFVLIFGITVKKASKCNSNKLFLFLIFAAFVIFCVSLIYLGMV